MHAKESSLVFMRNRQIEDIKRENEKLGKRLEAK
jgi:hypothetical protein